MIESPFLPTSFSSRGEVVATPVAERVGKILVVDDDLAIRLRVRDLLEAAGNFEVHEACDGIEGLATVKALRPDMVLLDLMMPGLSGLDVCVALRKDPLTREIPIIVLSAANENDSRPAALNAGAEDYISKPIPSAELRAKVANIMRLNRYQALRAERDRLSWLLEHSAEAVLRMSARGRLKQANRQARELFGLPLSSGAEQEGEGAEDVGALIGRDYRVDPPDVFARLSRGEAGGDFNFGLHRPESSLANARWFSVEVHGGTDNPAADRLLKFTERSDAVRRQVETWSFQRMISHKLCTPINGVGPILDLLLDDPDALAAPDARELLISARESANRLEGTIQSILRYQDALSGVVAPAQAEAASGWADLLRVVAQEAGLAPGLVVVEGEGGERPLTGRGVESMRLVLAEFLENYTKFGFVKERGLSARFSRVPGHVRLRLFAPGPPITPEMLARLGSAYWQQEKRFTGEVPGTGLGLATCRLVLSSMGADLNFAASEIPSGLVITVSLPCEP